jgi:drug/metabolite transporter (DMT)-like permease
MPFIHLDKSRANGPNGRGRSIFGDTRYVRLLLFVRSVVGYGALALSFLAVERMPLGDSQVLVMLSPVWAALGACCVLKEPWHLPEFFATMLSLLGACLVVKPQFLFGEGGGEAEADSAPIDRLGTSFALLSSFSAAASFLCIRVLGTTAKMPWTSVCLAQAVGQVVLSVVVLLCARRDVHLRMSAWHMGLVLGGGFVGAWSQILMTIGMQREKSAAATSMRMSDVVFAFLWQTIFTSDRASLLSIAGAGLVAGGIMLIVVSKKETPTSTSTSTATATSASTYTTCEDVDGKFLPPPSPSLRASYIQLAYLKAATLHRQCRPCRCFERRSRYLKVDTSDVTSEKEHSDTSKEDHSDASQETPSDTSQEATSTSRVTI